jgi:hypothetical protein
LDKDVDILLNDMKTMTKSELEGLRLGTMQNLLDRLGGAQTADTVVGATGGSGIVIIRYPSNQFTAKATTGSPLTYITGPWRVYVFNSSGTITF